LAIASIDISIVGLQTAASRSVFQRGAGKTASVEQRHCFLQDALALVSQDFVAHRLDIR
jgi:hypothetical protein